MNLGIVYLLISGGKHDNCRLHRPDHPASVYRGILTEGAVIARLSEHSQGCPDNLQSGACGNCGESVPGRFALTQQGFNFEPQPWSLASVR